MDVILAELALAGAAVYAGVKKLVVYCLAAAAGALLLVEEALREVARLAG